MALVLVGLASAPSLARAQGRDAKATTEAQAEAQKEEQAQGSRSLGSTDLIDPSDPTLQAVPMERRSSVTVGLSLGASLGSLAGFPNDPIKIGLNRYYTDSGIGAGYGARFWVGVALRDWLTIGLMGASMGFDAGDKVAFTGTVGFHTEVFPLYLLGGAFRDVGLMVDTGAGTGFVMPKSDTSALLVDGSLGSSVGIGGFFEGFRLGTKLGMGPYLSYEYLFSGSMRGGGMVLGWRTALYPRQK